MIHFQDHGILDIGDAVGALSVSNLLSATMDNLLANAKSRISKSSNLHANLLGDVFDKPADS